MLDTMILSIMMSVIGVIVYGWCGLGMLRIIERGLMRNGIKCPSRSCSRYEQVLILFAWLPLLIGAVVTPGMWDEK